MSDAETARPHRQAAAPKVTLRRGESAKQPPDLPHGMSADMTKWTTDDHQRFEEHQRRPQLAALGQEPAAAPEPETGIQIIARYVVRVIDPETGRQEITDALGRKLVVQDLDPVEELDLYEAYGNNSMNRAVRRNSPYGGVPALDHQRHRHTSQSVPPEHPAHSRCPASTRPPGHDGSARGSCRCVTHSGRDNRRCRRVERAGKN